MPYYAVMDASSGQIVRVESAEPAKLSDGHMAVALPTKWSDTDEVLLRHTAWNGERAVAQRHRARAHDRAYMEARLTEECDRSRRTSKPFSLLFMVTEESDTDSPSRIPLTAEGIGLNTRLCDVVAVMSDTSLAVLLVDCDAQGAAIAFRRVTGHLGAESGSWYVTSMTFPEDAQRIESLIGD